MTQGLVVALAVLLTVFVLLNWRRKKSVSSEPELRHVPKRIPELGWWEPEVPHVPKQIGPVSPVSWWDQNKYGVASGALVGAGGLAYLYWKREAELRRLEEMYREFYEEEIPTNPEQLRAFRAGWKELMDEW